MKPRTPPKIATWLIEHFGTGRHNESLSGDLIEEYMQGRSRRWYWRQAVNVVVISLVKTAFGKILAGVFGVGWVFCEFAVVMGCIGIADGWRHASLSLPMIFNVLFLIALGWFGFCLMKWARKIRQHQRSTGDIT